MDNAQVNAVKTYLTHLNASNTDGLIAAFEEDGIVQSPFSGEVRAKAFFPQLSAASNASVITLLDLFSSVQPNAQQTRVAAYFRYDWTLNDGKSVCFDCVDVFTFRKTSALIQRMQIVYDTHPLRGMVGDKLEIASR